MLTYRGMGQKSNHSEDLILSDTELEKILGTQFNDLTAEQKVCLAIDLYQFTELIVENIKL